MIELTVKKGRLELLGHSGNATLADLLEETKRFAGASKRSAVRCRMCGECCSRPPVLGLDILQLSARAGMSAGQWAASRLEVPPFPDMAAREKGVLELCRQTGLPEREAAVLYEYNQSEPVTFRLNEEGRCFYQQGNLCGSFGERAFVCWLYLCRFGDKLQELLELVVTQGTWHAYAVLGGVPAEAIPHNPFVGKESYDQVLLKDFEVGLDKAIGEMFSYF